MEVWQCGHQSRGRAAVNLHVRWCHCGHWGEVLVIFDKRSGSVDNEADAWQYDIGYCNPTFISRT